MRRRVVVERGRRDHGEAPCRENIRGGFLTLASGRGAAAVLSWIWLMVAARSLSTADFGRLALLLALGSIFSVVGDLGLPLVLMQIVSKQAAAAHDALLVTVRRRLIAGSVAALGLVGAFVVTTGDRSLIPWVYAISVVSTTVHSSVAAAFRALGTTRVEATNEVVSRAFVLVVGGWWVAHGGGLLAAAATYSAADLISAAVLWSMARRRMPARTGRVEGHQFVLARTLPLALAGILGTVYYRIDVWLLAALRDAVSVARYASAYRVLDGLLLPAGALSAMMVPYAARRATSRLMADVDRLLRRAALAALPFAVATAAAGPLILRLAFGRSYAVAAGVLAVLMLAAVPTVAVLVLAPVAATIDRGRFARLVAVALALNVAANLVLIPIWGGVGAAWATVLSQVFLAVKLRGCVADAVRVDLSRLDAVTEGCRGA